jgi:hypothetical protein
MSGCKPRDYFLLPPLRSFLIPVILDSSSSGVCLVLKMVSFNKTYYLSKKLSTVKIFPKEVVQRKKATRGGTLGFQIALQGKSATSLGPKSL